MTPFWRREETLNEKLAREGDLSITGDGRDERPPRVLEPSPARSGGLLSELVAIHGSPRPREWDVVASANVAGLAGDAVHFVALPSGRLVVEEDLPDEPLALLAHAVAAALDPPYRAEAIRRGEETWAIGARRLEVVEIAAGLEGDELELSVHEGSRMLVVAGEPSGLDVPELQALAEGHESFVVRAVRLDGTVWEADVFPL
ncbi:MAG: hypothetical protein M3304_03675 [Actinomycetota bacterium]|nr:hypothetical protein [Actinomycetota bacterium]